MLLQLDFFQTEQTELDCIKSEIRLVKESSEKVRRGIFARHGELAKKYLELHERMEIIERNICRGEVSLPTRFQS